MFWFARMIILIEIARLVVALPLRRELVAKASISVLVVFINTHENRLRLPALAEERVERPKDARARLRGHDVEMLLPLDGTEELAHLVLGRFAQKLELHVVPKRPEGAAVRRRRT